MICIKRVKRFCREDISLIENYEKALNDPNETWHCHHRLETELNLSRNELKKLNKYYGVEAKYLIFLKPYEHMSLHYKGSNNPMYGKAGFANKKHTEEYKQKMSKLHSGSGNPVYGKQLKKYKWLTPSGEIVEMCKSPVTRCHPDWVRI